MKQLVRAFVKKVPVAYQAFNWWRGWRIHNPDSPMPTYPLGGDGGEFNYGAWAIPKALKLDSSSIVYSAGAGFDISFDLAMIKQADCSVFVFDPGEDVAQFIASESLPDGFKFEQVAIGDVDGDLTYSTLGHHGVSLLASEASDHRFIFDEQRSGVFKTKTLPTIMQERGHTHIDLLKMDIEGAEYGVIADMLESEIYPTCILVEFHHLQLKAFDKTRASVAALKAAGYRNFWISDLGAEYGFIRTP